MLGDNVIYVRKEHIAYIVLNRIEVNNAINQRLACELKDICNQINQETNIYVIIITGAGETFCCGNEVEQAYSTYGLPRLSGLVRGCRVAESIASIKQPVIAAINGDALGQGLELALSCDFRIASREAHLGLPQVSMGFIPMDGGTQYLPRIIGKGKALELILAAETIDATEALTIGLVNKVVAKEAVNFEAEAVAKAMATKGAVAIRYAKEAVNRGLDLTLDQGLRLEADLYFLLHTTHDRQEGIKAFLEKRQPRFKGK